MTEGVNKPRKDGVKEDPGASYLKRPVDLGYDLEKEILEEARRRREALLRHDCEHKDWHARHGFNGVTVTSKKEPDSPFCMTKGVTDAPLGMTLEDVRTQFQSDFRSAEAVEHIYPRVDPMVLQLTIVTPLKHKELLNENEYEKLNILWGAFYVAPLISDRDFCFAMHTSQTTCPVTGETVFCSNSFSWKLPEIVPDMQQSLGRIRAEIQVTGYTFRPHPTESNRLKMAYMGQADPKGMLPVAVVNFASSSQAANCGRTRDIYEHYHHHVRPFMKEFRYPLDSYQLPWRGGTIVHNVPLMAPEAGKPFYVRLQAHSDHSITVQLEEDGAATNGFTLESVDGDENSDILVKGKVVTFGGKPEFVLDTVVKVSTGGEGTPELPLQFTNHAWKKTIICLPVNMIISATIPTPSNEAEQ